MLKGVLLLKKNFVIADSHVTKTQKKKAKEMEMERKMQLNIIYRSKDDDDDAVEYILCLHNNREREPAALIETSLKILCIS